MTDCKGIPEYENYHISKKGDVISTKFNKIKKLKSFICSGRYRMIMLYKEGKPKTFTIHQLMAITYLNHKPNGNTMVVDHIDNNILNNNLDNLRIVTNRENVTRNIGGKSKHAGVCFSKAENKWTSRITINKKREFLGYFQTEAEAHLAYEQELRNTL